MVRRDADEREGETEADFYGETVGRYAIELT
jgi:hypothetical protein